MNESNWSLRARGLVTLVAVAMAVLGLGGSRALADEPIVGLWQATASNGGTPLWNVIMAWTSDGLEVEDYALPILEGHICYGHWIKLQGRTYAQTHPYFEYDEKTGEWAGTSGLINYKITVSDDGKTFTGQQSGKSGVPRPNPYAAGGTSYAGITLNGTKVEVDKRLLP
jgi:hypothetical protein